MWWLACNTLPLRLPLPPPSSDVSVANDPALRAGSLKWTIGTGSTMGAVLGSYLGAGFFSTVYRCLSASLSLCCLCSASARADSFFPTSFFFVLRCLAVSPPPLLLPLLPLLARFALLLPVLERRVFFPRSVHCPHVKRVLHTSDQTHIVSINNVAGKHWKKSLSPLFLWKRQAIGQAV